MIVLLLMRLKNEARGDGRGALDLGFASWLRLSEGFEGDGIFSAGGCGYILYYKTILVRLDVWCEMCCISDAKACWPAV